MKKAFTGHASALRFTQNTAALLALLLLCASVTACTQTPDDTDSTDTSVTTEETGMKNGDVFVMDGHLSEVVYPLKENMVNYAVSLFSTIHSTYLADGNHNVAIAIVPAKNQFAEESGSYADGTLSDVPFFTYESMADIVREGTASFAQYIELKSTLSLSDYYYTDMHWKQEALTDTAAAICSAFGLELSFTADTNTFTTHPFVGSYTADPLMADAKQDTMYYLTNDILNAVTVTDYQNGVPQPGVLYNTEIKSDAKTYDLFLSGPMPLQVLESPNAATDRELILFRDSFGSSIAPYFCEQYAKVTLVDLRYLNSGVLADFIEFDDQDVLFLYSTHILNTAMILK
ncbi:MAG: hypothetical protein E7604_12585 [Ruminococcaceae bacterium]|nr:hypothetical protein [Oscillospiraceae bacterium]